jgi:O-antigen ligase
VVAGQDPHNDFLNVWLSWGILSLVAYVALFAGTLANLLASLRQRDPLLRGVAVGCVGGLVTYAVNSAYHNYLDSSVVLWVYAGLSAALAGLATPGSFLAHWGRGRARRGRHMALSVHSVAPPRRSGSAQPRAADNGARRYA